MKVTPVENIPVHRRPGVFTKAAIEVRNEVTRRPGQWFRFDDLPGTGSTESRCRRLREECVALGLEATVRRGSLYVRSSEEGA